MIQLVASTKEYGAMNCSATPTIRPHAAWSACPLAAVLLLGALAGESAAQGPQPGGNLPFSNIYQRPALSPYTALGFQGNNPLTGGTLGAMQGLVQPQLQQQAQIRTSMQQARQISQLQRQARQARPMGGTQLQTIRATGHASTFMELSHFYPSAR
jgi:hypothetical protein